MASPFLREGPDLPLERPRVARLLVNLPISLGDSGRAHQPARIEIGERRLALALLDAVAHPFRIDPRIDDQMRDMDALGTELARRALGHRAQAELGAGKRRIADAAALASRGAGEEDVAAPARQHQPRRLARRQETGVARQFPNLAEHALGGFEYREIDIGTDIEDAQFERRRRIGLAQKRRDLILLASVERAGNDA